MRLPIMAAAMLALAGCTPNLQSSLEKTCSALTTGYSAFAIAKEAGQIPADTVKKVDAAYTGAQAICANPPADAATAALQVAAAYVIIVKALR